MAEDLDEVPAPEDLDDLEDDDLDALDTDDDDLGTALVDDDDDDVALEDDDALSDVADVAEVAVPVVTERAATTTEKPSEESDEEEEDEPEDEDVEASLDVILKERLVVEDEPEDDELTDVEDRAEGTERVLPKQPDEFVCRSCFLVKHPSQLADAKRILCRDCV